MSAVVGYDFTIHAGHNDFGLDVHQVARHLTEWCKKWVFQLEVCPSTGRDHFQGRVSLIKAKRVGELISQIPLKADWRITSTGVHKTNNFNYVMKADTRKPGDGSGPWKDTDYEEPPVLTRQLKTFMKHDLRPWQRQVLGWCKEEDDRSIKLIHDTVGFSGKSIFSEYLEYHNLAFEMPPLRLMEDIMQFVFSFSNKACYLVDMPRAMKKDKLGEFYAGLECLKNGVCYDKRYTGKKRRMDRPQIIVFTNTLPEWSLMSMDRWEAWEMQSDFSLARIDPVGGASL